MSARADDLTPEQFSEKLDASLERNPNPQVYVGEARNHPDASGLWVERTTLGVIVHAQTSGKRLDFGMSREQATLFANMVLDAAQDHRN